MRAIPTLVIMAVLIVATAFIVDRPGTVAIVWRGWRIDTSVAVLVFGVVALALVGTIVVGILRRIVGGPRAFLRSRRERRRRAGYRALTQGMVAVAAGDPEEAQRQARKADVLLAEPPLTLLLSAQAAQLNGDEDAARKYFNAMLNRPETEFLGLRGLMMQAVRRGDQEAALQLAERARALRPKTAWVLTSLFDLQARRGLWAEAEATLAEARKRRAIPAEAARRHEAALLCERSRAAEEAADPRAALRLAERAAAADPSFTPATLRAAGQLKLAGRQRQAAKLIEQAWRQNPHPALAELYRALAPDEAPLTRVKRMERLASFNPDHPESQIAVAAAAIAAKLWGEARRRLERISAPANGQDGPSARVCRLMADLEEAEHGDGPAARAWLERAAAARPDPVYVCATCGAETRNWEAICPGCGEFDTLAWKTPPYALPLLASEIALPAPAAPEEDAGGSASAGKPVLAAGGPANGTTG